MQDARFDGQKANHDVMNVMDCIPLIQILAHVI